MHFSAFIDVVMAAYTPYVILIVDLLTLLISELLYSQYIQFTSGTTKAVPIMPSLIHRPKSLPHEIPCASITMLHTLHPLGMQAESVVEPLCIHSVVCGRYTFASSPPAAHDRIIIL